MSKSKRHHYVPCHLQNGFAANDDGQVYCFDKQTGSAFKTNTANVMAETYFNEFEAEVEGEKIRISFENEMTSIEEIYLGALNKIRQTRDVKSLTDEELHKLRIMVAFQFIRSKAFRENMTHVEKSIISRMEDFVPEDMSNEMIERMSPEQAKLGHANFISENLNYFANILRNRDAILFYPPEGHQLYLGDSPTVLSNSKDKDKFWGNLGWSCIGIEIYIPIATDLLLGFWCPSILESFIADYQKGKKVHALSIMTGNITEHTEELAKQGRIMCRYIKELSEDKLSELPITSLRHYNSLQVTYSERFLVSSKNNFQLAEEMIKDDSGYKSGTRAEIK